MKRAEVVLGKVYLVKVSGKLAPVRITENLGMFTPVIRLNYAPNSRHLGWKGVNTRTGREVRIRSAAKLRQEVLEVSL